MADVLPGYTYKRSTGQFHYLSNGQFVARERILGLLDSQINGAERRLGDLVTALYEERIAPAIFQEQMRTELRRLHLQNAALGAGGFDRLTSREYGRAGQMLRGDYERLTNLARDIVSGKATLPQALVRVQGYVGTARVNFLEAERDAVRATGIEYEERRRLGVAEHCDDCVGYAAQGWQPLGVLPVPGDGSVCGSRCRCSLERREVEA